MLMSPFEAKTGHFGVRAWPTYPVVFAGNASKGHEVDADSRAEMLEEVRTQALVSPAFQPRQEVLVLSPALDLGREIPVERGAPRRELIALVEYQAAGVGVDQDERRSRLFHGV
jgi:hypothetical protein